MNEKRSAIMRSSQAMLLALLGLTLGACSQSTDDLDRYISDTLQRSAPPPDRFEPPEDLPSHSYPSGLDRDPFSRLSFVEPRVSAREASGPRPDPNRRQEELEQYPLDALRMSGVLERQGERWALVRDPQGTIHRVREGNYLGQNHGRIVTITERALELEELVRTGDERWQHRSATLASRE
ncbi:MAG: pilus assembly protein PilP [Ectothiorhodospiraceae bacterium]|nr:pilus assembly protein PilP [Ectothiorhodospiraceae bacterium]